MYLVPLNCRGHLQCRYDEVEPDPVDDVSALARGLPYRALPCPHTRQDAACMSHASLAAACTACPQPCHFRVSS